MHAVLPPDYLSACLSAGGNTRPIASNVTDAHRVWTRLWQGSMPRGDALYQGGFDVVVLCAQEHQPRPHHYPGLQVVYAPMDDIEGARESAPSIALSANVARVLARYHRDGKRILVTCAQGRNRSGLTSAFTLQALGYPPVCSVELVRAARRNALTNRTFLRAALLGLGAVQ